MEANSALDVLTERISKELQLSSPAPPAPHLDYSMDRCNQNIWFVDDTNVYRETSHKTFEGNLTTKRINGALFIFNPRLGMLFVKVLHPSIWTGEHEFANVRECARWYLTASEVAALVRSVPVEEQPKQIIVTRTPALLPYNPLEICLNHLNFNPSIVITGSEVQLPFQACLNVEKLGDVIVKATETQSVVFNIYDDWLETISAHAAFSRLSLILGAFQVDSEKAKMVLKFDGETVVTLPHHTWPNFSDGQWVQVQFALWYLIALDCTKKINFERTQTQIQDILRGAEID